MEESREERERTREAGGSGVEDAARLMRKAQQHALELQEQAREEQRKLAHERRLTFKQKARMLAHSNVAPPCIDDVCFAGIMLSCWRGCCRRRGSATWACRAAAATT